MTFTRPTIAFGSFALGLAVAGVGVAVAVVPDEGRITACYAKNGGALRVVDRDRVSCRDTERPLAWRQRGVAGKDGADGRDAADGLQSIATGRQSLAVGSGRTSTIAATCPAGSSPIGGGFEAVWTPHTGEGEYSLALVGAHAEGQSWSLTLAKASEAVFNSGDRVRYEAHALCLDAP